MFKTCLKIGLSVVVLSLFAPLGCSDQAEDSGPCSVPAVGCPCVPSKDEDCCISLYHGLRCVGDQEGQWLEFDGCPCVFDPGSQCGGADMAVTCPGAEGL